MSLPDVPNTKREGYYAVMAGQRSTETLPENPVSTEDRYLDYIARNGGGGGGGGGGDVTGVKGDAEVEYRTGNVNITAANVGAYTTTQTNTLLNGKTDIVEGATENNFAAFDDSGNIKDSGKKAADFATPSNVAGEEIAGTATGTSITLTDSADGYVQGVTIKGRSEVISGEIVSVGDDGFTITTADSTETLTSTATLTTGLPLRSVSDMIFDTADNVKVTKKCAEVDLGDLTWTRQETSTTGVYNFFAYNNDNPCEINNTSTERLCANYVVVPVGDIYHGRTDNKTIGASNNGVWVRDDTYTDATTFKTAVTGVKLVYPLATPTETPLTSTEKSALASLRTYDHTTHIDATDEPTMTVDYLLNTNNGKAVAKVDNKIGEKYTTEKTKLAGVQDNATANDVIDTTVTLTVNGWVGNDAPYTQTVNVANVLSTDQAIVDLSVSSTVATGLDEIDDWALISKIETGSGTMTFTCYEDKPTTELTANVHIVRGTSSGAVSPVLKSVTWTGTGTTSRSITFPEKPTLILSIQFTNKDNINAGVVPFRYGVPSMFCMYGNSASSWSGSYASALTYSVDELTMTITGSDKGSAWNDETTDYILYYM